jgi:IPTL-CTERM motif
MNKFLTGLLGSILIFASSATMSQILVGPGATEAWVSRNSNTGTLGLGIPDNNGGTGSLLMSTNGGVGQIIKAARLPFAPVAALTIDAISSISWDFYTSDAAYYPRPQLEYFSLAGGGGTLVYEASNLSPTAGSWQTASVNIGADLFRDTRTNTVATLASFQAGALNGVLMNFFQFGYGSTGGSFPAVTAYLDYPELNGSTWDFEAVVTLPPEPRPPTPAPTMSEWALILMAMLLVLVVYTRRKQFS